MVNASNANGDWGRLISGLEPIITLDTMCLSLTNSRSAGSATMVRFCPLHSPTHTHPCTSQHDDTFNQIQTRVFDPKGNETYVIARQADLTSLLWTITQTLTWTALTCLSRNDSTHLIDCRYHFHNKRRWWVAFVSLFYPLPYTYTMMNAMCMKIRWKLPSQTFGSVMIQMAISDLYLTSNICMKILFRPQANVSKTQ